MAKKEGKTKVKRIRSTEDKNLLISALVYIVLGAMLCIFRTQMLNWAMTVAGIIAIVIGVLAILKGDLVYGIDTAAIGATAAAKLIELIEKPRTALVDRILIPGKLVEGGSVRAI